MEESSEKVSRLRSLLWILYSARVTLDSLKHELNHLTQTGWKSNE